VLAAHKELIIQICLLAVLHHPLSLSLALRTNVCEQRRAHSRPRASGHFYKIILHSRKCIYDGGIVRDGFVQTARCNLKVMILYSIRIMGQRRAGGRMKRANQRSRADVAREN